MKIKFNKNVVLQVCVDEIHTEHQTFLEGATATFDIIKESRYRNDVSVQFTNGYVATIQNTDYRIVAFERAAEVRQFLKLKISTKFKVKYMNNPFGGEGRYWVKPETKGSVISSHVPGQPTQWSCSDPETGKAYEILQTALKGTNASPE